MKNLKDCYPISTFSEATQNEIIELFNERTEKQIGLMRQWLNEERITDPKKMVTDEELNYFLKQ